MMRQCRFRDARRRAATPPGDEHDLHVGEDGAEPGADERDRLVPESAARSPRITPLANASSARAGREDRRRGERPHQRQRRSAYAARKNVAVTGETAASRTNTAEKEMPRTA